MRTKEELLKSEFPAERVHVKVQAIKGEWALVVAYVDARAVMDRLDEVFGIDGWYDRYEVLVMTDNNWVVKCYLNVLADGGEYITKEDVGEGGDAKSAFSDALKRAAVKFGVARYLYEAPLHFVKVPNGQNADKVVRRQEKKILADMGLLKEEATTNE